MRSLSVYALGQQFVWFLLARTLHGVSSAFLIISGTATGSFTTGAHMRNQLQPLAIISTPPFAAMSLIAGLFDEEEQRCEKMGMAMSGIAVGVLGTCRCWTVGLITVSPREILVISGIHSDPPSRLTRMRIQPWPAVGYPYGSVMYNFFGKQSAFLAVNALICVLIGAPSQLASSLIRPSRPP